MSSIKSLARLVAVCQKEQVSSFDKRQIPINIDENLIMKLQVDDSHIQFSQHCYTKQNKTYQTFIESYKNLTIEELNDVLCVPISQIKEYILQCVPCIGCRTSIENFIKTLLEYQHEGLEPLIINENRLITVKETFCSNPDNIYTLFYFHGSKLNSFIESIPKSKKNRRCLIHSLDKLKSIHDWEFIWNIMNKECRDEITLVEADVLLDTLENYLHKHKFCSECKLKVLEAYDLLVDNSDYKYRERKGFCPALYEGLRSCSDDKHIHIDCNKEFLGNLIARAESEIQDSHRERHAKTLDIAQEELLTCIGIYLFERFDKIYRAVKSEEQTWQLLFYIAIDCLRLNFEKAIHHKKDFTVTLEILCEEFRTVDQMKSQKKQQKRSKRKVRRQSKANHIDDKNSNKILKKIDENQNSSEIVNNKNNEQQNDIRIRRRTSSCCSCFCHYCHERSNSLSMMSTIISSMRLVKSQSCPSSLLFTSESLKKPSDQINNGQKLQLSSSLETLFSSISTRECVCHEKNLEKQVSYDECPTSSSISCIRCSSTRTDLGYSSGQDEICSFVLCECSSTTCDACSTEPSNCCPLHEEDESGISDSLCNSIVSGSDYSHKCCTHKNLIDCPKTIELFDSSRKHKIKLQLCEDYPFFTMDLKQIWDESSSIDVENQIFISDDELHQFSMLNKNFNMKRAQLREILKCRFQAWKQRLLYRA